MTATEIFLVIVVIFLIGLVIVLTVLYCKKQNEIADNPQVRFLFIKISTLISCLKNNTVS